VKRPGNKPPQPAPATVAHLGEDRLVTQLTNLLPAPDARVRIGIGDDCAAVRSGSKTLELLKTDAVVEGVHFTAETDPARVGWKALARAISDIAAMGGWPEYALVTVAIPPSTPVLWMHGLYKGLRRAARKFGIQIIGGETTRSTGPVFASITLTGRVEPNRCVSRAGGRPGDILYVTGRLGGSLSGKHLDFIPRLEEARWLVTHFKPSALMDLSDGLGSDLPRMARASGCGYALDPDRVPRTRGASIAQALSDGEDFELLLAHPAKNAARLEAAWKKRFPRLPLTAIGCLTATPSAHSIPHGFDHFPQP
jgi:thiamine-monophosphate kinase